MKKLLLFWTAVLAVCFALTPVFSVEARSVFVEFKSDHAKINFPETVEFLTQVKSDTEIQDVVLEYGDEQLTCGSVVARAFPKFEPGKIVNLSWSWEMRRSGSVPPGTRLWWRWVVTDANGKQTASEKQTITWLDSTHKWQEVSGDGIRLHWYQGDSSFAQTLHETAVQSLEKMNKDAGLETDEEIDMYIYANSTDMRDAVLYEPGWTGGQAFATYNIVIIGINQDNLEWGKSTVAHELTHVITGHLTFNCLWGVPTWLEEGLATYSEGKLDDASQENFDKAVKDNTLMSLRALNGQFSEKSDKADLSYSQSFSVVKYLIETHGREKMSALLAAIREGKTADESLQQVYGLDTDGLEDAWRKAIKASPRPVTGKATPTKQPTAVPTFQPVSGVPNDSVTAVATPAVSPFPTLTSTPDGPLPTLPATQPVENAPDYAVLLSTLLGLCCCVALVVAVVIFLVIRYQRSNQNDAQA